MPVDFRIISEHALILVRYHGLAGHAETLECLAECAAEPGFDPTLPHIFDVRGVTAVEDDVLGFLSMQAKVGEVYAQDSTELRLVYITANEAGRRMANSVRKTWSYNESYIFFETEDAKQAFEFVGRPLIDIDTHFAEKRKSA